MVTVAEASTSVAGKIVGSIGLFILERSVWIDFMIFYGFSRLNVIAQIVQLKAYSFEN